MSIVAVISSPEKNGNTEFVVKTMAAELEAKGKEVKIFSINEMANRKGCQACFGCKRAGKCVIKDDLTPILDAIRDAEGVILSAPVYFNEAPGQYRLLEDRFFSFIDGTFTPNIPAGKKVAVVTAAGSAGAEALADKLEGVMAGFFKFTPVGKIAITTGNDKAYASKNADVIAQAKEIAGKF